MTQQSIQAVAPFFAVAVVATFMGNYMVNKIGQRHYDVDKNTAIFDFGHIALPRWRVRDHEIAIIEGVPLLSFFIGGVQPLLRALPDFMLVYGWVLALRVLTTVATILPKDDECDADKFGLQQVLTGYCFDKLFSGHTAFAVVVALVMVKHGIWNAGVAWIYPAWMGVYLLLTRGHYTSDIILGAVIAYLAFHVLVGS